MMILPTIFIFTGAPLSSARINGNLIFFLFYYCFEWWSKSLHPREVSPPGGYFWSPIDLAPYRQTLVSLNESLLVWPWDLCSGARSAGAAWSITNQKGGDDDRSMQLKLYWLFSIGNMCWYWWKFCTHIDWFVMMLWDLLTKLRLGIHPESLYRRRIWDG